MEIEHNPDRNMRWRLILGQEADPDEQSELDEDSQAMDQLLEELYQTKQKGGLGSSKPKVNRWLGDIRKYFSKPVVHIMQRDALDRLGLKQMLLEPELLESTEPDVHLVASLLALKSVIPDKTKETAREVVSKVVQEIMQRLQLPLQKALRGKPKRYGRALNPKLKEINWLRTIRANLKNYQPEEGFLIPEKLIGYSRRSEQLDTIFILGDLSGSMSESLVYVSVFAAVLASIPALNTRLILFDTEVVDLSDQVEDPVDLLFGVELGGGTDIRKALAYTRGELDRPNDTLCILISDLFEGANPEFFKSEIIKMKDSGVTLIALLALNNEGSPSFNRELASFLASLDIPCFACTPDQFPDLLAHSLAKKDPFHWLETQQIKVVR